MKNKYQKTALLIILAIFINTLAYGIGLYFQHDKLLNSVSFLNTVWLLLLIVVAVLAVIDIFKKQEKK